MTRRVATGRTGRAALTVPALMAAGALMAALLAGCGGPILANPPAPRTVPEVTAPRPSMLPDPQPIVLPADDGPHQRLTEWWYYTGHLVASDGRRFGFEAVIFRAERGSFPVSWASQVALTDESGGRFLYAQRSQIGASVDVAASLDRGPVGFALTIVGIDPANPGAPTGPVWAMVGTPGGDHIGAQLSTAEAATAGGAFALNLDLQSTKPPVLHHGDGWIDSGAAGGSYYYSRTALAAQGTIDLDGQTLSVTGTAWFDHQWGDFVAIGGGGWDWYAVNLADGTDLMIFRVRAADGSYSLAYGTLVRADGTVRSLDPSAFRVEADPARTWTSPRTGTTWPAGWVIAIPSEGLEIDLTPTVAGQELDTRATTGVVYWEGSQVVRATRKGTPLAGEAYVELTGYALAVP